MRFMQEGIDTTCPTLPTSPFHRELYIITRVEESLPKPNEWCFNQNTVTLLPNEASEVTLRIRPEDLPAVVAGVRNRAMAFSLSPSVYAKGFRAVGGPYADPHSTLLHVELMNSTDVPKSLKVNWLLGWVHPRIPPAVGGNINLFFKWERVVGSLRVLVDPHGPVRLVKEAIQAVCGAPPCEQFLIYGGKALRDDHSLADYSIENGATVTVNMRIRGGGGESAIRLASAAGLGTSPGDSPTSIGSVDLCLKGDAGGIENGEFKER